MDKKVAKLKTPEECERFAKNVIERGRPDLAEQARKRAIDLRAETHDAKSEVERECLQAIYAYEEILTNKNGRRTRATRTWQMIERHGILGAVERAVNREKEASGYMALCEMGLQDYAFEAVIVRHSECFSPETVQRAKKRIDQ